MKQNLEFWGTLGPACQSPDTLRALFAAGMTGARVNLSHGGLAGRRALLADYWQAARESGCPNARLAIDLQGPELRVGALPQPLALAQGGTVVLAEHGAAGAVPFPPQALAALTPGQAISLDDSALLLRAIRPQGQGWLCGVERGGLLQSHKSAALPGVALDLPPLTQADLQDLALAGALGVTDVLQPFVRGKADLLALRQALRQNGLGQARILAKLENRQGVERLAEILEACDVLVIARGDLGNGMPLWQLPRLQKEIAAQCRAAKRDFLVVTQLLHSMEHSAVPTRAEVSDIYNAVLDGVSSLMLTGETAAGQWPVQAMEYLVRTACTAL